MWALGPADVRAVVGLAHGLESPSVQLLLTVADEDADHLDAAGHGLALVARALGVSGFAGAGGWQDQQPSFDGLIRRWLVLMGKVFQQLAPVLSFNVAGYPLYQLRPNPVSQDGQSPRQALLYWPTYWPLALAPVLGWSLETWYKAVGTGDNTEAGTITLDDAQRQWRRVAASLKAQLPGGLNPPQMLAAARSLKLPVLWLDRETLQLGHGRRSRLLTSTLTDATPAIAVRIAKDKVRTAHLLRQGGVPTPLHREVADAAAAVMVAKELGWPVVVKPADLDRGDGARANLTTNEQVAAAFAHARKLSRRVLVEAHQAGCEYRLTVVHGKLLWAHERVPAAVTGDGQRTLQQLIESENALRQQQHQSHFGGLVAIQMDEDNLSYLREAGRSLQDIPSEGEVVRLQRVPAATTGGSGRAYFDTIHPDNRVVAERAAQLLRLDIAGVDLIMPDITRSWREVGGAVTEVNAVPQVSIQTDPTLTRAAVAATHAT
jgi:cyanophycin synthetase